MAAAGGRGKENFCEYYTLNPYELKNQKHILISWIFIAFTTISFAQTASSNSEYSPESRGDNG
ncbi:MAG: hypothetical protein KAI29_29235, partial [Cyclobacteriaceae bacterium]|nr:hypothetical protein [Cyclobacteriaceae bacterium]